MLIELINTFLISLCTNIYLYVQTQVCVLHQVVIQVLIFGQKFLQIQKGYSLDSILKHTPTFSISKKGEITHWGLYFALSISLNCLYSLHIYICIVCMCVCIKHHCFIHYNKRYDFAIFLTSCRITSDPNRNTDPIAWHI